MLRSGKSRQVLKTGMGRKPRHESAGGLVKKFIEHSARINSKREPQRRALT